MLHSPTTMPIARYTRILAGLLVCVAVSGCATVLKPVRKVSHLSGEVSVNVTVDPDANQDMPIAVDIVAVSEKKTLKDVSAMTAQAWFQRRTNYLRLHPSELRVYSWEWVPGQEIAPVRIPQAALADGIILFANYASPGEHSTTLPLSGTVRLELGPKDFKVVSGKS